MLLYNPCTKTQDIDVVIRQALSNHCFAMGFPLNFAPLLPHAHICFVHPQFHQIFPTVGYWIAPGHIWS
jgi:hypothetical protein